MTVTWKKISGQLINIFPPTRQAKCPFTVGHDPLYAYSAKKLPLLGRPRSLTCCLNKTYVCYTSHLCFSLMPTSHHTPLASLSPDFASFPVGTSPISLWIPHREWGLSTKVALLLRESLNFSEEETKMQRNWIRANIWENWGWQPKS